MKSKVRAKATRDFDGVPDGTAVTRRYRIGEEVTGELARAVVHAGWAVEEGDALAVAPPAPADAPAASLAGEGAAGPPAAAPAAPAAVTRPVPPVRRPARKV